MRVLIITLLLTLGAIPVSHGGHGIAKKEGDARPAMNNQRLDKLIRKIADKVQLLRNGIWHITIDAHQILIFTDENNNRMRIMMPVRDSKNHHAIDHAPIDAGQFRCHSGCTLRYCQQKAVECLYPSSVHTHPGGIYFRYHTSHQSA